MPKENGFSQSDTIPMHAHALKSTIYFICMSLACIYLTLFAMLNRLYTFLASLVAVLILSRRIWNVVVAIVIVVLVGHLIVRRIHRVRTAFVRDVSVLLGDGFGVFRVVFVRPCVSFVSVPLIMFRVLIRLCALHFIPVPLADCSGTVTRIVRN